MKVQSKFFAALMVLVAAASAAGEPAGDRLKVDSAFVKFLDQVDVPAAEGGILTELNVREGTTVTEGELLGRIDDARAQLALDRAKTEWTKAQLRASNELKIELASKSLEIARSDLRRGRESHERYRNSVSQDELDRLHLAVDRATLELEQARFALQEAEFDLRLRAHDVRVAEHDVFRRKVLAPFAGLIVERLRQRGEFVESGQTVLRLVGMKRLRVEGLVDAKLVTGNLVGQVVHVSSATPGGSTSTTGVVTFISPGVNPQDGKLQLWAEIDNQKLLFRPGMQCEVFVEL